MKNKSEQKYYIQSRNLHLMNVLEENYYIELGSIDMSKINCILKGEKINLVDIIDLELLSDGIGSITSDPITDIYYQLNYLINLRLKNSTCKFILTAGTIKYFDELECEKYAPVVLIPFDFDYQHMEIIASSTPLINPLLTRYVSKFPKKGKNDENKILEYYYNHKINSSSDIDRICLNFAKELNTTVDPTNHFTIAFVEYPDIVLDKDYMSIERSINEMTEQAINEKYFKEIKGVLPTNLIQKYVILKANEGEKFAVDGKLGSGKTYTILNIIADQINKGKKILYVNQDLDNIIDIEKYLSYLGISNYTYNLTKNLREIIKDDLETEEIEVENISKETFNDTFLFPRLLQKRVRGYKVQNIFDNLAVLKQENKNIKRIPLEVHLEYHEANQILQELESIEESLKSIDLYANNIWHRLQTSHNNITKNDIVTRIKDLFNIHKDLTKELKDYVKKYNFKLPNNVNELYKLVLDIYSFVTVRPLAKWKIENVRRDVLKNLREIQALVDINYNVNKYYNAHINKTYHKGRIKEIFDIIISNHIKVDHEYNTQDAIFINKLIAFDDKLIQLINSIDHNIERMDDVKSKLMRFFNLNEINNSAYTFFTNFNAFLSNNKQYVEIYDAFIMSQSLFTKYGEEVSEAYAILKDLNSYLPNYLNHFNLIDMEDIGSCLNKRNPEKALAIYINTRNVKKANKEISEITKSMINYYDAKKKINNNLTALFGKDTFDDTFINTFINFYQFATALNIHEKLHFKSFLDKFSINSSRDTYLNTIKNILNEFKEEGYQITSICTAIRGYGINIIEDNLFEKVESLKKYSKYLKNVNLLKEEIKDIYNNVDSITYKDLVDLMKCDDQYQYVHETLKKNEAAYKINLGKYYNGLDTIINEVGRTVTHYEEFLKNLNNPSLVDELFIDKKFEELLKDTKHLDNLHSHWSAAYRMFSVCFKGSQPEMLINSFDTNTKLFKQFIDKVDQIEPVLKINSLTEGFLEYGLKDLYDGIRSCKYGIGVSKNFIYSVLYLNYEEALKLYPRLSSIDDFIGYINNYVKFERTYCQKNIENLVKKANEVSKYITYGHGIEFNEYNKVVKTLSKYVKIFLADLDIFNTNLDLQMFDLVIMDDVHLSSSNKYNRLCECKQVITFGDRLFQTSVSNALMKRLGDICTVSYKRRYVSSNSKFNNTWDYDNQYIYEYSKKYNIIMSDTFDDFMNDIFEKFKENTDHIINILVGSEQTRRQIYTAVVKKLALSFSAEEIINILCYKIRILNAFTEGNRYVNDIYIYFDDFKNIQTTEKERIFKNFVSAHNSVNIYYIKNRIDKENQNTKKMIQESIGKTSFNIGETTGIVKLLKEELAKEFDNVENGFGSFDLVIKNTTPYGIMIVGKADENLTSFIDDYQYYHNEYEFRGWKVKVIYILELFHNFDKVVKEILEEVK